ncbi:MAG TPA: hypothetical protein VHO70_02355 [Chitinispirillaceae bacterium]|nr:hypothetical protein [Chitinispirillaceae bacterium]
MKSFSCGRIPLSQIYIKVSFNRLFRLLLAEIKKAPEHIQLKYDEIVSINSEIFTPYYETFELFEQYQKHEIISEKYTNDMLHIALATIANVDTSGTLFDLIKIRQFNAVNLEYGYRTLSIHAPREVTLYENEKDL